MSDNNPNENVKKVPAFPIEVYLSSDETMPKQKAFIVKMTDYGFLMQTDGTHIYQVGHKYQIQFSLPVYHYDIQSQSKVIKTYDGIESKTPGEVQKNYLVELHFINLPVAHKQKINQYLKEAVEKK